MSPTDWFDYVAKNESYIVSQVKASFPGILLSSILPGLPNTVYLRKMHGMIELTFDAVQLDVDEKGTITHIHRLAPSDLAPAGRDYEV